ncbi:MAG TPA: hypothetical protein VGX78_00370 [Pirellulales bacterium]|nr:hypothetical protein [Pirellulales bacterium]
MSTSSPGCVILLLDESAGMGAAMGEVTTDGKASTRSNADRVATAVNSLLAQLALGPSFDLALVGYQADGAGLVNVGCRWSGPLAGRDFVATGELAAAPLRVETRTRKISSAGGFGVAREDPVNFPVWYAPALGVKAPQIAAFDYCRGLLTCWLAGAGPSPGLPLVVHVASGASGDGNPQVAVGKLMELATPLGPPVLLQAHLAAHAAVASALYPSTYVYLTLGSSRDLFRRASLLPPHLADALRESKIPVNAGARGLIYNAKIADVIRMFGLVKAHTRDWPTKDGAPAAVTPTAPTAPMASFSSPTSESTATETAASAGGQKSALVVLVLDRSVADPYSGNIQNPLTKLQDQANDLLKQISKLNELDIDTAIVSYGADSAGQPEVRDTFDGPLAGRATVNSRDLADGAIRVEEIEEQVSNGVGGLLTVTRKKPIYFDLEPTAACPLVAGYSAAARIASDWCAAHPLVCLAPVVVHLTRGAAEPADVELGSADLARVSCAAGAVTLYQVLSTEAPHKSLAYPAGDEEIEGAGLKSLFSATSPLLARQRLAAERPKTIVPDARGIVINGKFDLLLEGIKEALE